MLSDALQEVVRILVSDYGPIERILLFGSAARGQQDEHSDLDLIVIKRTAERWQRRLVTVPALPVRADVFVYTPEEFAQMQAHENPFVLSALRDAVVVYEKRGE